MTDAERRERLAGRVLFGLFFISGVAALVYQTVWIRKFSWVLGGTVNSMSVVVSTFMAGLAIGAAVLGRVADRTKRPLLIYAIIELGIAGLAVILDRTDAVRARMAQAMIDSPELPGTIPARIALAVIWLGPPCFLMGGTLPVMVKHVVRRLASVGSQVGALYFLNTLGAAVGALSTGLFLVELLGLSGATMVAVAINVVVGLAALVIGRLPASSVEPSAPEPAAAAAPPPRPRSLAVPALAFFVSGFCALLLELSWTRLVLGFLDAGAMVISLNLFFVLVGFAVGGAAVSRFADVSPAPRVLAAGLLAGAALAAMVGMSSIEVLALGDTTGYWPPAEALFAMAGLIFPAATLMGAGFPVLVKTLVSSGERLGQQVGGFYALNTIGTVLGGLAAPFLLIPSIGVSHTLLLGAGLQLAVAVLFMVTEPGVGKRPKAVIWGMVAVTAALMVPNRDAYHEALRQNAAAEYPHWAMERAYVEGADSTVILYEADEIGRQTQRDDNRFRIQVNSSALVAFDTNETKLMAHLPLAAVPDPKRALVICFGMGNTFRSALAHGIEVDVVDINAAIPELARIHQADPSRTFDNPRGRIYINDGRNYLLLTDKKYDMITIDPAPPTYGLGLGNIQSKEFYQLVADRLTDQGVAEAWMVAHLKGDFELTLAAFRAVFPHVAIFKGVRYAAFHVLGSKSPIRISKARLDKLFSDPELKADLGETDISYFSPELFEQIYQTDERGVDSLIRGHQPLTDDRPNLEYRALRGLQIIRMGLNPRGKRPLPLGP